MPVLKIDDSPLPPELFHYTGGGGLLGILESQSLWATHAGFLNDAQEVIYGQKKIVELLNALTAKQWSLPQELNDDALWHPNFNSAARWFAGKFLLLVVMAAVQNTTKFLQQNVGPFVTCLSAEGDQLSQWRGYAGDGGYAIKFDSEAFRQAVKSHPLGTQLKFDDSSPVPVELGRRHFVEMRYTTDDDFIRNGLMDFFRSLLAHLATNNNDDPNFDRQTFERVGRDIVNQRMSWILGIIMQTKNPGFVEEKEYRVITFAEPDRIHATHMGLVPRVDLKFDPTCVKEIIVGPGGHQDVRQSSIEYYCNARPQYSHVVVWASETPFRGT
jgi:hypothetical protein